MLLGERDGRAWFAVVAGPEAAAAAKDEWFPLRGLLPGLVGAEQTGARPSRGSDAPLVFHALGLAEWLFATRYCPRCGEPPRARGSAGARAGAARNCRHRRSSRARTRR